LVVFSVLLVSVFIAALSEEFRPFAITLLAHFTTAFLRPALVACCASGDPSLFRSIFRENRRYNCYSCSGD
jgi:hypothetical protein